MTSRPKKTPLSKEIVKQKLKERKKNSKLKLKEKRARLLVKNLSFKVTEDKLKDLFGNYGEISGIDLLKKPDGKLVGCAFVQFNLVQKAAKARHHLNGKEFLGRKIEVDFAKPKNKYKNEKQISQQSDVKVSEVEDSFEPTNEVEIKTESVSSLENDEKDHSVLSESEVSSETESEEVSEGDSVKEEIQNERNLDNNHHYSHDVSEGKTIFIKNVPFEATNNDLKSCMSQFGRTYYALICVDKLTEHSKGTAFVKFVNKEDADHALNAGTELKLFNNILDCHPALDHKQIQVKQSDKQNSKTQPKDSRNLYLVKEGVIPAASSASEGVSSSDMVKRTQIEQYKTQMLRNLKMFVSKERLVVHNLPPSWDDQKLRILLQKYGGPGATIKEARVMRDRKNLDTNGLGTSKQYGFVTFTKHEHALMALRNLNNNPNIFTSNKRPIIVFSIENRSAIVAKQKRLEKSKVQNQVKKKIDEEKLEKKKKVNKFNKFLARKKFNKKKNSASTQDSQAVPEFSGVRVIKS